MYIIHTRTHSLTYCSLIIPRCVWSLKCDFNGSCGGILQLYTECSHQSCYQRRHCFSTNISSFIILTSLYTPQLQSLTSVLLYKCINFMVYCHFLSAGNVRVREWELNCTADVHIQCWLWVKLSIFAVLSYFLFCLCPQPMFSVTPSLATNVNAAAAAAAAFNPYLGPVSPGLMPADILPSTPVLVTSNPSVPVPAAAAAAQKLMRTDRLEVRNMFTHAHRCT